MIRVLLIFGAYLALGQSAIKYCKVTQGAECFAESGVWGRPKSGYTGFIVTGQKHTIPDDQITASSFFQSGYEPVFVRINNTSGSGAWLQVSGLTDQWIQFNFGKPWTILGIVTKGRYSYDQWVTSYEVKYQERLLPRTRTTSAKNYSSDHGNWINATYETAAELGACSTFPGNFDRSTPQVNLLLQPFTAESIRIYPKTYHNYASLRADFIGCFENE